MFDSLFSVASLLISQLCTTIIPRSRRAHLLPSSRASRHLNGNKQRRVVLEIFSINIHERNALFILRASVRFVRSVRLFVQWARSQFALRSALFSCCSAAWIIFLPCTSSSSRHNNNSSSRVHRQPSLHPSSSNRTGVKMGVATSGCVKYTQRYF